MQHTGITSLYLLKYRYLNSTCYITHIIEHEICLPRVTIHVPHVTYRMVPQYGGVILVGRHRAVQLGPGALDLPVDVDGAAGSHQDRLRVCLAHVLSSRP